MLTCAQKASHAMTLSPRNTIPHCQVNWGMIGKNCRATLLPSVSLIEPIGFRQFRSVCGMKRELAVGHFVLNVVRVAVRDWPEPALADHVSQMLGCSEVGCAGIVQSSQYQGSPLSFFRHSRS